LGIALIALPHMAALGLMVWSELRSCRRWSSVDLGLVHFFWLMVLRRPRPWRRAMSLFMIVVLRSCSSAVNTR